LNAELIKKVCKSFDNQEYCHTCADRHMTVHGSISREFMTIYAVIIAFYFGTQTQKSQTGSGDGAQK
jgi:hypothetical protein